MPEAVSPPKSLAVVTMVYNEPDFLPLWLEYYGWQVGYENCYVIDHGSDDGSTSDCGGASRIRLPRTLFDIQQKVDYISEFCSSLLKWYDYVAYTDVDEILVADPRHHRSLVEYCAVAPHPVTTAFGMNLVHRLHHESAFMPGQLITAQRHWGVGSASMCKPLLTRVPIRWDPGFHSSDAPIAFDDLFLFHLAYFDLQIAMRRQAKRRATPRKPEIPTHHHKMADEKIYAFIEGWSSMPREENIDLGRDCPVRKQFADRVVQSSLDRQDKVFKVDLDIWGGKLWQVPGRFRF